MVTSTKSFILQDSDALEALKKLKIPSVFERSFNLCECDDSPFYRYELRSNPRVYGFLRKETDLPLKWVYALDFYKLVVHQSQVTHILSWSEIQKWYVDMRAEPPPLPEEVSAGTTYVPGAVPVPTPLRKPSPLRVSNHGY